MSLSQVDIINKALDYLGTNTIVSLTEATAQAEASVRNYDRVRDEVLRGANWGFATSITSLAALANEVVPGWSYLYLYPIDCLRVRKVFEESEDTRPAKREFRIMISPVTQVKVIAANITPLYLEYTKRVTDPTFYDPLFIDALALRLGASLANTLTGKAETGTELLQKYGLQLSEARRVGAIEQEIENDDESSYLQARG